MISPWCLNFSGAGFIFTVSSQVVLKVSILKDVVWLRSEQLHSWDELKTIEMSAVNIFFAKTDTRMLL